MNLRSLVPFSNRGTLTRSDQNIFGSLHREIDRLLDDFTRSVSVVPNGNLLPSVDVAESDKEITISAELPGLERKDVDISVEDDVLVIRGEKSVEQEKDDKKKNYHVTERNYGMFYRMLQLPPGVDPSSIKATMSNGVLKVVIPKPARSEAKKIEVKEAA